MNLKKIAGLALALLIAIAGSAQKKYEYRVKAGFNVGGTSPLPIPAEIRKIKSFSPTMNFSIEGNVIRHLDEKWGVMTGLRFETKGMSTHARVKNYSLVIDVSQGDETGTIEGVFTGDVKTEVKNEYITLPLLAARRVSERWFLKAGPYFSYLIKGGFNGSAYDGYIRDQNPVGNKVGVETSTYDFSDDITGFDWGGEFGAEWKAYSHLSVYGDLTWSAKSIFKKGFRSIGFNMYNIYLNLGFAYVF